MLRDSFQSSGAENQISEGPLLITNRPRRRALCACAPSLWRKAMPVGRRRRAEQVTKHSPVPPRDGQPDSVYCRKSQSRWCPRKRISTERPCPHTHTHTHTRWGLEEKTKKLGENNSDIKWCVWGGGRWASYELTLFVCSFVSLLVRWETSSQGRPLRSCPLINRQ